MQHLVNLRGEKKHHDTTGIMIAASSPVLSSTSRGRTQMRIYGSLFIVSARTNKRHHHHHADTRETAQAEAKRITTEARAEAQRITAAAQDAAQASVM